MNLRLEPGECLGIVGPNGAGKSTLIRMLLGDLEPDTGERQVGETVQFMSIDQMRSTLDPKASVIEQVAGRNEVLRIGDQTVRVESFLDKWGFPARSHSTPVSLLSGGERNRVLLAQLLCAGGNVLVLDEPTNDLDLNTLRALEEALLDFPGAVIVVSHDRWFLDRIASRVLYLDGKGGMRIHPGDLSGLLEKLAQDEAETAANAKRASKPAKKAAAEAASPASPKTKRITPWQQKELDGIEGRIAELEESIGALDGRLADPEIYSGPREALEEVQQERAKLESELNAAMERWEELESLKG